MMLAPPPLTLPKRLIAGFTAGFLSTLTFHQATLAFLWGVGVAPFRPFAMISTMPFGVPLVVSLAFWGGVWGLLYAVLEQRFPHGRSYWFMAFLFGAVLASLVAWLVVLPLKGRPMGGGWHLSFLATGFLINGAWGVGTGVIMRMIMKWSGSSPSSAYQY